MVIATERRDAAVHSAGPKQLPLARVRNVRDLGGYAYRAEDGSQGETAYGIFLRGPSLRKLTPGDYEYLQEYGEGLKCVVDLRSDFEVGHWPDPYSCMYHYIISRLQFIQKFRRNLPLCSISIYHCHAFIYSHYLC